MTERDSMINSKTERWADGRNVEAQGLRYLGQVAEVGERLGYHGPANRSLYELTMRLTNGRPTVSDLRRMAEVAHGQGLLSDQFTSGQLAIFRPISDMSPDAQDPAMLDQPIWQRIVSEAEEVSDKLPWIYGDPDTLWRDIANLYGLDLQTTFSPLQRAIDQESRKNTDLPAGEQLYTAPIWAAHDMFSDEQYAEPGFGKGFSTNIEAWRANS